MTDLKQFRENSIKRSLCEGYTDKWSEHKTKRELFELACDSNAVSYMAQSISEGWGLSPQYISEKFKPFINNSIRKVCQIDFESGKLLNIFDSLEMASKQVNTASSNTIPPSTPCQR